jgi:metal-responsive CopG/Arc/MetJ family transcriptional regulator
MKRIAFSLPAELYESVQEMAKREYCNSSELIRRAIVAILRKDKHE